MNYSKENQLWIAWCFAGKVLLKGAYLRDGMLVSHGRDETFEIAFSQLPIKGPHNAVNALASISVAQLLEVSEEKIIEGLKSFKNAPHRLEEVEIIDNVTYINDSKATNVDSVFMHWAALINLWF
jgi:UDP-N-acetylmuramoylalanine--D-glutamate ligase